MHYGFAGSFVVVDHEGNPASQRWTSPKGWEVDFHKGRIEVFRPGDGEDFDRHVARFWSGYLQIGDVEVVTIPGDDCHGVAMWSESFDRKVLAGRFIVASKHDTVTAEQVAGVMAEANRMRPSISTLLASAPPLYVGGPNGDPDDPAQWETAEMVEPIPRTRPVYPIPEKLRSVRWNRCAFACGYGASVSDDDGPHLPTLPPWVQISDRRPEVYTPRAWAHFLARRVDAKLLHRRARALWRRGKRAVHRVTRDTKAGL